MTKLILGARRSGKTTKLIEESERFGYYIITRDKKTAHEIMEQALEHNKSIPFPITYAEFNNQQYVGKHIRGFLIDDVENFLSRLSFGVPIISITMSPDDVNIISGIQ